MLVKELIKALQELNPDGEVCVIDHKQCYGWQIVEVITCEDRSSEWFKGYADIVIDYFE